MGHLRQGNLPVKTKAWQTVVLAVGSFASDKFSERIISDIADKTLSASSRALRDLPYDKSLQSCFKFLVTLAVAGQSRDIKSSIHALGINIVEEPTKLVLSRALRDWLTRHEIRKFNPEYDSLARKATTDTITEWINQNLSEKQLKIFTQKQNLFQPWRAASNGSGFCELARVFFSNFTSRYLKYFLSRTASAQLKTITDRDSFDALINRNIEEVSRYAFETSKIVQSFSAGWFNKNAIGKLPSSKLIEGYLIHSFEKIREELRCEEGN